MKQERHGKKLNNYTFQNLTISVLAVDAKDAYTSLCCLLQTANFEFCSDTYCGEDGIEKPTEPLWGQG